MREPCMTIKELARLVGLSEGALHKRAKRKPLPEQVKFEHSKSLGRLTARNFGVSGQYKRSELLNWFQNSTVYNKDK